MNTLQQVRVRYAPSPTGSLHVGGVRTALFNWLFARKNNGTFVLRIEDTDLERSTEESVEQLKRSLRWIGLEWDEGPEVGGPHTPYRQTERMELYREAAQRLLDSGAAYHDFATPEELNLFREKARSEGRQPIYTGGEYRNMDPEETRRKIDAGEPYTVRLNTPRQILLHKALGNELPAFAHVPQVLGPDRKKLSKRHGAASVEDFAAQG